MRRVGKGFLKSFVELMKMETAAIRQQCYLNKVVRSRSPFLASSTCARATHEESASRATPSHFVRRAIDLFASFTLHSLFVCSPVPLIK